MTKQSCASAGLLSKQGWEVANLPEQNRGGDKVEQNLKGSNKIHISEITKQEFREAYCKGETTGVMKLSQKRKADLS